MQPDALAMPMNPITRCEAPVAGLPVDGHVHFHRLDRVAPTLDAAAANFAGVGSSEPALLGALMLVQSSSERVFEALAEGGSASAWRIAPVPAEPQCLLASSAGKSILIVRGQQICCAHGLEVLALGTTTDYPHGLELDQAIGRVQGDGHIAVMPWGFLKWRGYRGDQVRRLVESRHPGSLLFGDNGGRLAALGMPELLQFAEGAGFRVLPGTDPFPFGRDYRRVGAFGFLAGLDLDLQTPWAALERWLADDASRPMPYGRALGPLRFVFNQGWIQVHNRLLQRTAR